VRRDWPSEALRTGSLATLRLGLTDYLRRSAGFLDARDVMTGLAPYHDCARRLGGDTAAVFAEAATNLSSDVRDLAVTFGQRVDVTLSAFSWELDHDPTEGPTYRHRWWPPPGTPDAPAS
jgi:hypothetical protein